MVDERTDALTREGEARRADVQLFVHLLENMQQSHSRAELWQLALPQICGRFAAQRIAWLVREAGRIVPTRRGRRFLNRLLEMFLD